MAASIARTSFPKFSSNLSNCVKHMVSANVVAGDQVHLCKNRFYSSSTQTSHASPPYKQFDVVIVGAGIIGLATAQELISRHGNLRLAVVDKEKKVAAHQSGHNSGVIHAGIYYTPGSLKAKLCVEGMKLIYKYCDEHAIPYKKVGKLIVAVEPHEIPRLDDLYDRGIKNGVPDLTVVDGDHISDLEPNCKGLKALWSPHTGIIDFGEVTKSYGKKFEEKGGEIFLEHEVKDFVIGAEGTPGNPEHKYPVTLIFKNGNLFKSRYVITCGGLYSDKLAEKSGCDRTPRIVPFRGEYLLLKPGKEDLVRTNIYPVPDPKLPFLGVHFTPRMNGDVWLGPNAVLAYRREGYTYTDIHIPELIESLQYRGLQKLIMKHLWTGFGEMYRGINMNAQVKQLQRFVPSLKPEDCIRGPAGVRAQALGMDGSLVDDFVFDSGKGELGSRILHVRNAPSPAATSSLSIANMVVDKAEQDFEL